MSWQRELKGPERDAAAALISLFESYGLGSLAPKIVQFIQQGYGRETIAIMLQETREYKQRFAANEARRKAGLSVLSPAEYLATERAYAQALQSAGMPKGFYDDPAKDFRRFLERDISPTEIAERAGRAREYVNTLDPVQRDWLRRNRGLTNADLAAYFLDSSRALPVLERQVQETLLGAERARAGYDYSHRMAQRLYQAGITAEQARQGYGVIGEIEPTYSRLAEISGENFGVRDLERELFFSDAGAATGRKRLASQERARFGGSAGTGSQTLARDDRFN
jgi:hypothetical protein